MNTSSKNSIPVCILIGPTGVGKTAVISEYFHSNFEIVNADATQVYKYLDIGSAKPSAQLQSLIPHHLIDIAEPDKQFTVADFVEQADNTISEIISRKNRPLICGGTGFYIRNFIFGLAACPPSDAGIRNALLEECKEKGLGRMYELLNEVDAESADRINRNDEYRILRALEIYKISGKLLSAFQVPDKPREKYRFLTIGLFRERKELVDRIYRRVDEMFENGLCEEVQHLIERGFCENDPGLRGIGYSEFFKMIKGCATIAEVKEQIQLHSRQYAKRQMTFFRKLPDVEWYLPSDGAKIFARAEDFFNKKQE